MISNCISDDFEYGYPHSNALLQFRLKKEHCMPHEAARHPTKCDVINQTIFDSISEDILLQIFDIIQADVSLQNQVH